MNNIIQMILIICIIIVSYKLFDTLYELIKFENINDTNDSEYISNYTLNLNNYFKTVKFNQCIDNINDFMYKSRIHYIDELRKYLTYIDNINELDIDINECASIMFNSNGNIFNDKMGVLSINHFANNMINNSYPYIIISNNNEYCAIYKIDSFNFDEKANIIQLEIENKTTILLKLIDNEIDIQGDGFGLNDFEISIPICISDKSSYNIIPYTILGPIITEYISLIYSDYIDYYSDYISFSKFNALTETHFIIGKEVIFKKLCELFERYNIGLDEDALGSVLISFYLLELINK